MRQDGEVDYDLARLGTREFEHLVQGLAVQVLGANVQVFGDGRDGGREATFDGMTRYPNSHKPWDGYGVVQAKFFQRPRDPAANATWLITEISAEAEQWLDRRRREVGNTRRPEYMIFATNVVLSPVPGVGGIDKVNDVLETVAAAMGLSGWALWHHDQICRFLDGHANIRRAYAALTTPGDVLSRLVDLVPESARLGPSLIRHVTKSMLAGEYVRLDQAGDRSDHPLPLSQVAIDLPAVTVDAPPRQIPAVATFVVNRGNEVWRPSTGCASPHLVVVGGPGQGKSTLGQLICQIYRAALLADRPAHSLGPRAAALLTTLSDGLSGLDLPPVISRRWPIQVDLSAYGDALAADKTESLLAYLASEVSRAGERVDVHDMRMWLRNWPWLLVLDGLDEVAAVSSRSAVTQGIDEFLVDAADLDADVLIVATTRPQGYAEQFSPIYYQHLELRLLTVEEAVDYGQRLAQARHADAPHRIDEVTDRVRAAATEHVTARLMQSPLQVTIMSLLLERRSRAPRDRYTLFAAYYDTIYGREVAKPGPTAALLDEQRVHVHALHEAVALRLHIQAERNGEAQSLLAQDELLRMAEGRLLAEGHVGAVASDLAHRLVKASTHRLVLLVPLRQSAVGFEVRSLQEFMAARAITAGDTDGILKRLVRIACSPHWRNTWLLAAGRLFTDREHMRSDLMTLIEQVDHDGMINSITLPGAALALDLLHDDVAIRAPHFQAMIADRALRLLRLGPGDHIRQLAQALMPMYIENARVAELVKYSIDLAGQSSGRQGVAAVHLLTEWTQHTGGQTEWAQNCLVRVVSTLTRQQHDAVIVLENVYGYRVPRLAEDKFDDQMLSGRTSSRASNMIGALIDIATDLPSHEDLRERARHVLLELMDHETSTANFDRKITALVIPLMNAQHPENQFALALIEQLAQLSVLCELRYWPQADYLRKLVRELSERTSAGLSVN
ncbi:hypothetical protein [Umezawaea sp. Da 62-37]|uniref:NACHT domain-containing protein n=1 Tax=Umezawaea sp. Da 62-37 TaxID=3075927 RepID=UPI0028F6FD31|nr:hypothetical protein [Umezawaea sp. Da 62-37]WNV87648.1 hypothetical protein RM788_04930 [Umezawaea sp. Da 62-37]